jgi:hypothetical protein
LPKEGERGQLDSGLIDQLRLRHPKHLASLFRTLLEKRNDLDMQDLAKAIMKSALPKDEKVALFSMPGKHRDYLHGRLWGLFLSEHDKRQFSELLLVAIQGLPKDVDKDYWSSAEVRAANLIAGTDDPQVWQALEKAAKQAEIGLRMQFINLADWPRQARPSNRKLALRFLESFLDDSSVRDATLNKEKFILCAAHNYPRIEVRNFAATQILLLAKKEVPEKPGRTAAEWAEVRDKAGEVLKLELARDPKP